MTAQTVGTTAFAQEGQAAPQIADDGQSLRKFRDTNKDPGDWTKVVQRAADSGERAIYIPPDVDAVCKDTVVFRKAGQTWYSSGFKSGQLRRSTLVAEPFIICDTIGIAFRDLAIVGPGRFREVRQSGIEGRRLSPEKPADIDLDIRNAKISGWHYGVSMYGRGLKVDNVLFSLNRYWINLDFPKEGTFGRGETFHQQDGLGYRAFQFTNIRSHANGVGGVRNVGEQAGLIGGVYIANVLADIGGSIWIGSLNRALISGVNVDLTNRPAFSITGGSDWEISSFRIAGEPSLLRRRNPMNFIELSGHHSNCVLTNGTLAYNSRDGIVMGENGTLDAVEVSDIFFIDPCYDGKEYCPISIKGDGHSIAVKDISVSTTQNIHAVIAGGDKSYVSINGIETFGKKFSVRSK